MDNKKLDRRKWDEWDTALSIYLLVWVAVLSLGVVGMFVRS